MLLALILSAGTPDIILTRSEAERLSPRRLEALLLADFPHGSIRTVVVTPSASDLPPTPLSHISFHEQGQADNGSFCTARRIGVSFDTVHGKVPQDDSDRAPDAPRRRFHVGAVPLVAVLGERATDRACAAVRDFAQLPHREPAIGLRLVAAVLDLSRRAVRTGRVPVPVTCTDETTRPIAGCDGTRVLASLDWKHLGDVDLPSSIRGPTTRLQFWRGSNWTVEVTGLDQVRSLALRRRYPPPF